MKLLGEVLFARDHYNAWTADSCELKPLATLDGFQRLDDYIPDTHVEMKARKDACVHARFDRVSGATIRRSIEVEHRSTNEIFEPVTEGRSRRTLQHFPDGCVGLVRVARCQYRSLHGEIYVNCGAGCFEAKLQRIPTLESPRRMVGLKQSRQQPVECHLPTQAIDVNLLC